MTFYLWLYDLMTINSLDEQIVRWDTTMLHVCGSDYSYDIHLRWLSKFDYNEKPYKYI